MQQVLANHAEGLPRPILLFIGNVRAAEAGRRFLPGQVDYLAGLLGDRALIFPFGGHCGNMDHRDNVAAMVDWLRGE